MYLTTVNGDLVVRSMTGSVLFPIKWFGQLLRAK